MALNYYPEDHPLWKLLRLVVVCATLVICLNLLYHNGWAPKDYITLINTLAVLGGYDVLKSKLTHKKRPAPAEVTDDADPTRDT